jgi:hypothetical protein
MTFGFAEGGQVAMAKVESALLRPPPECLEFGVCFNRHQTGCISSSRGQIVPVLTSMLRRMGVSWTRTITNGEAEIARTGYLLVLQRLHSGLRKVRGDCLTHRSRRAGR